MAYDWQVFEIFEYRTTTIPVYRQAILNDERSWLLVLLQFLLGWIASRSRLRHRHSFSAGGRRCRPRGVMCDVNHDRSLKYFI